MPLSPDNLADALEQRWFAHAGSSSPRSPAESADRLAGCIAPWFAQALAAGFPCTTALPRQAQLAALVTVALTTGSSATAGGLLSAAIVLYITGQSFGPGVALPPTATALPSAELSALLADLNAPVTARAKRFATACSVLALSTLVSFPMPPFVAPIN